MPKFHVYLSTVHELVAKRIMETDGESTDDKMDDATTTLDVDNGGKYYYLKNTIICTVSSVLQYASVNGTLSLVTSLAGERKGFAALFVTYLAGYLAILSPGLITSLGCKKVIVTVNIGYLVFTIGNFFTEYYTLLPAGVFGGFSIATVWVSVTTYLNTLGVSYARAYKASENRMISYTNGISTACFSGGIFIGNLVSSLLLTPTRNSDEIKDFNSTEKCSLGQPENLSENQWVYIFRGTLTGMCTVALILSVFFLDNLKEEAVSKFSMTKLFMDIKESIVESGKAILQPNVGLIVPLIITCGIAIAVFPGTFSRVYIAECVGVHIVGYIFIVYGGAGAVGSICVSKVIGWISITSVALLTMCLNVGIVAFLLIWKREPSYYVIFVIAILWGICDGSWSIVNSTRVALKLFPRYGSVLGGTAVQVFGPCFDAYAEQNIMCSFDGVEVPGLYINKDSVICVSPAMTRLGRVDFALHISGTTMQFAKTTFYSFAIDDASTVEVDSLLYMSNEKLEMTWGHRSLLPEALARRHTVNVVVNIDLVEIDIDSGSTRTIVQLANNVTNSGEYRARIPPEYDGISAAVVRITVADIQIESPADSTVDYVQTFYSQIERKLAYWSRMFYVSGSNVLQHRCKEWYDDQPDGIGDEILQQLPACPPTESRMTNAFIKEDYGDTYREFFHPSTSSCYRQRVFTRDNQGSGQQCCYDNNGNLATGQPGGGTVDSYAPNNLTGSLNHLRHDILPYIYCCKGELKEYTCDMYYKKRPSDDGSRFILQPPACMYGDPHLVTLDGYKYTFNGKGEFTLIGHKDDIFTVQGRMVEAENSFGLPVNATVFSAVAVKQHNSDTIEFKRSRRGLDTYVNGVMVNFEDLPRQDFNNVVLSDLGNQTVSALFSSGAYVKTKAENGIISVLLVSLPDSFYNATYGLMGVFNKNTTDDLMIANSGEYLPLDSTSDTIHQFFGVTWIISENASLFRYSSEESWATYHDPHFISSYNPQFSSPSLENKAISACDEDEFCLYDVAITGRIEIGLSTLDGSRSLDEMVKLSYPIICDPPCAHGACVANNTCNCAKGYSGARCTEPVIGKCDINLCRNGGICFKMAATHKCDCINDYGGMLCRNKTDDPPTAPTSDGNDDSELLKRPWLIIAAGVAGGVLVILVVFIICIVSCCCHRRYKRRNLTVDSKRINPTNPMYDMNLFLVPDKAKTDTTSSVKPLVPYAADSDRAPANQIQNYANLNSSKREYDTVAIGRDLRMNENPLP